MAARTQPFETISSELTAVADDLVASYGGHVTGEDLLGRWHSRSEEQPTLLTRFMYDDLSRPIYGLEVFDLSQGDKHLSYLGFWVARTHDANITDGQLNTFEKRIQRGVTLLDRSGILYFQFYPKLLDKQPEPEQPEAVGEQA